MNKKSLMVQWANLSRLRGQSQETNEDLTVSFHKQLPLKPCREPERTLRVSSH